MHPGHPAIGSMGEDLPFDRRLHDDFQMLLAGFGRPDIVEMKKRVLQVVGDGGSPEGFVMQGDRFARSAVRLALRQQARFAEATGDIALALTVAAWQRVYDPNGEAEEEDEDAPGH